MDNLSKEELKFHAIIEREVQQLAFGGMTINVLLVDGKPKLSTLNIVKTRRIRYRDGGRLNGE